MQTGFLSSVQVLVTTGVIYIHGGGKSKDPKGKSGKREGSLILGSTSRFHTPIHSFTNLGTRSFLLSLG